MISLFFTKRIKFKEIYEDNINLHCEKERNDSFLPSNICIEMKRLRMEGWHGSMATRKKTMTWMYSFEWKYNDSDRNTHTSYSLLDVKNRNCFILTTSWSGFPTPPRLPELISISVNIFHAVIPAYTFTWHEVHKASAGGWGFEHK